MSSDIGFSAGEILLGFILISVAVQGWPWRLPGRAERLTLRRQLLAALAVASSGFGMMTAIVLVFKSRGWWPWGS